MDLKSRIELDDLESIESYFKELKEHDKKLFKNTMSELKLYFTAQSDNTQLNKMALIFSTFKIHSSVPLIISKIICDSYNLNGGTLIYALNGLRIKHHKNKLAIMLSKKISWEMSEMLRLVKVESFKSNSLQ